MLSAIVYQKKGLLDWCVCDVHVIGWSCGRLGEGK